MADPVRQRGFVTHRQVRCGACNAIQVVPASVVGKVPCGACGIVLSVAKGTSTLNPSR